MTSRLRASGAAALVAGCATVLGACGAPRAAWSPSWSRPYATFDRDARVAFTAARVRMDAGDALGAWEELDRLCAEHPDNIELAVWRQEAELVLLREPEPPAALAYFGDEGTPEERLRVHYAELADRYSSVVAHVLAARVEEDAIAAQNSLDFAIQLDPGCAWAHYGHAHALLRQELKAERWRAARRSLDEALEKDGSHLRARRLEAWMDAQEGATERAAAKLEVWLAATADDPRVTEPDRLAAELDLAATWILRGRAGDALALLATREGEPHERPRRLALVAVALQETGDLAGALDAARRAEDAAPGTLLPTVQEALLLEYGLGRDEAARERWLRVAEAAEGAGDLGAMLQGLRAQVELERLARESD